MDWLITSFGSQNHANWTSFCEFFPASNWSSVCTLYSVHCASVYSCVCVYFAWKRTVCTKQRRWQQYALSFIAVLSLTFTLKLVVFIENDFLFFRSCHCWKCSRFASFQTRWFFLFVSFLCLICVLRRFSHTLCHSSFVQSIFFSLGLLFTSGLPSDLFSCQMVEKLVLSFVVQISS